MIGFKGLREVKMQKRSFLMIYRGANVIQFCFCFYQHAIFAHIVSLFDIDVLGDLQYMICEKRIEIKKVSVLSIIIELGISRTMHFKIFCSILVSHFDHKLYNYNDMMCRVFGLLVFLDPLFPPFQNN